MLFCSMLQDDFEMSNNLGNSPEETHGSSRIKIINRITCALPTDATPTATSLQVPGARGWSLDVSGLHSLVHVSTSTEHRLSRASAAVFRQTETQKPKSVLAGGGGSEGSPRDRWLTGA